jgi:Glycosyl hydrolase family 79 C-terminal beta domain
MRAPARRRFFGADVAVVIAVALLVIVLALATGGHGTADSPPSAVAAVPSATSFARGALVPAGFLGLSLEYPAIEQYAGTNPAAIDPVFVQLIRNLTPGQQTVLRIGGDSSDSTWWPVAGVARPPGVTFTLTRNWLAVTKALAAATNARLILGVNLEADNQELAAVEARELLSGIGTSSVRALELGNEPELYGAFAWYRTADGQKVTGRPHGYDFTDYTRDYANFVAALPRYPLAGPAVSGPKWMRDLGQFLQSEPGIGVVTLHRYPLQNCFMPRCSPRYPSIQHLLSPAASTGLADEIAPYAAIALAHHIPFRLDELNTVSCGADRATSQTFASALWAIDALFELARAGVDGVNIHTFPGAGYELFTLSQAGGRWRATVSPEYYGLLMFAQAAPPGSRLLRIGGTSGRIKVWATRAPDGRVRIVVINKDVAHPHVVSLPAPGARGAASLERLQAPNADSTTGVTLGGQSFATDTETGSLAPASDDSVNERGGRYLVTMPAASAALITLPKS